MTIPRPWVGKMLFSIWKIAEKPPPSGSAPRIPNSDELDETRNTSGFGHFDGQPGPDCLPLTTSMSTLMRPYSVTLVSCARAEGALSIPATATATSFDLKYWLRLRMISQRRARFA